MIGREVCENFPLPPDSNRQRMLREVVPRDSMSTAHESVAVLEVT